jgi:hypothetical protein
MEKAHAGEVPASASWRALPLERKLHWLLRLGVVGCFIGHGVYGVLTKEAWVPISAGSASTGHGPTG